jgi:CubicO group peptidase (beta-lactamase class C family)
LQHLTDNFDFDPNGMPHQGAGMKIFHCKIGIMIKRYLNLFAFIFFLVSSNAQIKSLNGGEISRAGMDQFLKQQMDSLGIPGMSIAIINNGRIVYHRALGIVSVVSGQRVDDHSIFEAASLSKPLFAYFVMKMVDKGLLSLDTPLYKYMPYTDIENDERYKLITARLVLSHQTGFPNWRYFNKADSSLHVKDGDLYIKFTPGSQFSYSGEGYLYLAKVVAFLEHRSLQTLDPLFQQEVARPLGMEHAWYTGNGFISRHEVSGHEDGKVFGHAEGRLWGQDESSNGYAWPSVFPGWDSSWFNPAASLHTEAMSYAHFLIGLMQGKGLSKKSLEEMLRPQSILPRDNILYKLYQDPAWGLGLGIIETPLGTRYDHAGSNGNFESHAVFYKDRKYGYVFFVNCNKGDDFYRRLNEFLGTTTTER